MRDLVHVLLIGPEITRVGLAGADPDAVLPVLHDEASMNRWRIEQYENRRARWVLKQKPPELAELAIARRADIGRHLQSQLVARSKRPKLAAVSKPQQARA